MGLVYRASIYSDAFLKQGFYSVAISRTTQEEAVQCVLVLLHGTAVRVLSVERHPKFQRPLDYALNVRYAVGGETVEQMIHIYKTWGRLDPEYVEISNRLVYGKGTFECSICQTVGIDEEAHLHPTRQVVCCVGCAQE